MPGHYALLTDKCTLIFDVSLPDRTHKLLPRTEETNACPLQRPVAEVTIYLYYLLGMWRCQEGQQHQLAPPVEFSLPPLALIQNLSIFHQLTESLRNVVLVATSLVRELVLIGNFTYGGVGNLNLDVFLATGVDVVEDGVQVLDWLLQ